MTTSQGSKRAPHGGTVRAYSRPYIITLDTNKGKRQIKIVAKPGFAHTPLQRPNARTRALLKGAGSLVAFMPSFPSRIRRGKIGSFAETSRRVGQTWHNSFQTAKE